MDVLTGLGIAVETMAEPLADEDIPDYEFTVDWGDGTTSEFKSLSETPDAWWHTYETKGLYTVSVNGYFCEVFSITIHRDTLLKTESRYMTLTGRCFIPTTMPCSVISPRLSRGATPDSLI